MKVTPSTRRTFIKTAATAVTAFQFLPRHVLGGPRFVPPSEKVNVAVVGVGGRGTQNMKALMALDAAPNLVLDTSSSNGWIRYHPGLTLRDVFARALDVAGPDRLIFGTDSSFFPRGWQAAVWLEQRSVLDSLGVDSDTQSRIFGGNFARIFGVR